ncbi:mechanosensitive ion channel family protein [Paracoccus sp. (in: a-proteobacteria)]|uniref:mechanosensitive ion channel family protein n=1 Tax=Paracoccus sp. TaxID=267 RepID=UPI0026E0916E|nr:DUF3772 domain-containing protein [Paracoccus sp. (in: a-proteobacteria)]MDO5369338.1 DUF3772 domain-containing protein [Paracoccus sp. (in: a-proteobacteria)]
MRDGFCPAASRRLAAFAAMLAAVLWLALAAAAMAQGAEEPDYAAWDRLANRSEQLVETPEGTADDLATLRAEVVGWRDRFSQAQSINAPRIATLREQIAALGPAPAEGETEAEDIAARRRELSAQLSELQAPGQRALEAYSRADSLVRAIDEEARTRQTNALLRLSPSPLLPGSWAAAANEGMQVVRGIVQDVRDRTYGAAGEAVVRRLPLVGLYLLAALGLLIFGRRWVDRLPLRLSSRASDYARDAVVFVVSLGQIAIPTIGAYLLIRAVDTTGLVGPWGRPILTALPTAALIVFAGRWLGRQFFPLRTDPPICYPVEKRQQARVLTTLLAIAAGLHHVVAQALLPLSGLRSGTASRRVPMEFTEAAAAVWHLPILLLGALTLYRLCHILHRANAYTAPGTPGYRNRIIAILGNLARLAAVVAPLALLGGLVTMANALLWPMAMTVGLVTLVILLQDFATDLWVLVRRNRDGSRNDLTPVLIGYGLVLLSLPLLALIWGARSTELAEFWTQLRQGISLGGVRLSPGAILTFILVFGLGYMLTGVVQGLVRTSILPRTRLDEGAKNAAVSGLGYVGIVLAALIAISAAGIDMSSFAIVAGALSVGIGFGLQNIVSNFVSGIILLVERPVAVGDWIQVGASQGYVRRISVRSTRIQTFDRTDIVVPNSDLISKEVTNWTRGNLQGRIIVAVNVAYGADTRQVSKILMEIAEDQPTVLINPAPSVLFTGFANEGMTFEIRAIISDINQGLGVSTEIRHQIVERFRAKGIAIPFTVRDFYNEEGTVLSQAVAITGKSPDATEEPADEQGLLRAAAISHPDRLDAGGNA